MKLDFKMIMKILNAIDHVEQTVKGGQKKRDKVISIVTDGADVAGHLVALAGAPEAGAARQPGDEGRVLLALHPTPVQGACDEQTTSCLRHRLAMLSRACLDAAHGYTDPVLLDTVRAVMYEVMLVASAYGARLEIDPTEFLRLGASMGAVRTSMLQDLEAGRALEIDALVGAVREIGQHLGLATPNIDALFGLVRLRGVRLATPPTSRAWIV